MNTRTFLSLIAFGLVILLTGCATTHEPWVAGVNAPTTIKTDDYYKTNLKDVIAKAEAGDAEAQFEAAWIIGSRGDITKSNYWLEKAASQNYLSAVSMLGARHYYYKNWNYPKDDALAENLSYRAYEIYLSKPSSEWNVFETRNAESALILIADKNLSNKDKAHDLLCKAKHIGSSDANTIYVLNDDLKKIGRTCN